MNPAVTLGFAVVKRLPWIKVPVYWTAQMLGAITASACCYGVYYGKQFCRDKSRQIKNTWQAFIIISHYTFQNTRAFYNIPTIHFKTPTTYFKKLTTYFKIPITRFKIRTLYIHFKTPTTHFKIFNTHLK